MKPDPVDINAMEENIIWAEKNAFPPDYDGSEQIAKIKAVFAELRSLRAWKERLAKRLTPEEVANEFIQDGKYGITIAGIICGIKNDILDKQLILYREKIADLIRQDREDE